MDSRFAFEVGTTLCVQVSIVVAANFLLQGWIRDARSNCRLWTVCFVSIIALVAAALLLPHRRMFSVPNSLDRETMLGIVIWQGRLATGLLFVWMTGVLGSLIGRGWHYLQLRDFLNRRCEPVNSSALLERLNLAAQSPFGLNILSSAELQVPFCWQLHRPVIVLPTRLIDNDETTLRHVLLHELEHLRNQHPMQHFLQGVCSTLFWFHPAIWIAARGAELNREFLCDEIAAKTAGRFGAYLQTLAKVAEYYGHSARTNVPMGTLSFGNQKSVLVRRSDRLVELARNRPPVRPWRPLAAIGILLVLVVFVQQIWLPTNVMASSRSDWSPWPTWTANALHHLNIQVRDFEAFDDRVQMHELLADDGQD